MGKYFEIFRLGFESTKELLVGLLLGIFAVLTFGLGSVLIFGFAGEPEIEKFNHRVKE